ncbi:hypothetical protein QE152_g34482 [Popillia japonica]|uniref:Uncharacterized protein n=1 Tax=Popillia japonica TaxID=7064 RepID=A0AAW1ITS9_POPJA
MELRRLSTVNRWAIKSGNSEPGQLNISDEQRSGRQFSASDYKHFSRVDNLIRSDHRITQRIADALGISNERRGFIFQKLGYRKICARWVPRMLTEKNKRQQTTFGTLSTRRQISFQNCDLETKVGFIITTLKKSGRIWSTDIAIHRSLKNSERLQRTTFCSIFREARGAVMMGYLEKGCTVNSERYRYYESVFDEYDAPIT